jgi:predicted ferric reductase
MGTARGSWQSADMRPALKAELALGGAVVTHLVAVETMLLAAGPERNGLLTAARFLGLHVATVMMVQLVLVARVPWLDRRLGMDRLTAWHRWTGIALAWAVLTHGTLAVLGFARLDDASVPATFASLAGVPASLLGMGAAAIIAVVVVISTRWARRRLPYEVFHAVHLCLYVAIGLALVHQALEGTAFTASALGTTYWWSVWTAVILTFLVGRVVVPVRRNLRHRFEVAAVVPESDDVVSVYVTGRALKSMPGVAGQFCIWHFPGHFGWWQANPFSLSAAPDERGLRLTAKAVGDISTGLRDLPVGSRVLVEGPYGAFTTLQRSQQATLLIAGGIGITPLRALLEEDTGPTILIYRVRSMADAVLLPELESLARKRGADLRVLAGKTGEGDPPVPAFDAQSLAAMVPDIGQRDVYVCGPPPMTQAVLDGLRELGLTRSQVHYERFGLG